MMARLRRCTMSEDNQISDTEDLQERLAEVQVLLARHKLVEDLVHRQEGPRHDLVEDIVHKQHLNALQARLAPMHPADIAYILEALPLDERLIAWDLVKAEREGEILLEVSDAVRETLIDSMERTELVAAAETLDADELADLVPDLPQDVVADVFQSLSVEEREQLRAAMSYPEESVGSIMDFEMVTVREDVSLEVVLRYLRRFDELPDHTDQLFVVDRDDRLKGVLPLNILLVNEVEVEVGEGVAREALHLAVGAPQHGLHARQQLADRERLGHVVVGAELEPEELVDLVVPAGEHEDVRARPVADVARMGKTALKAFFCAALLFGIAVSRGI